MFLLLLFGCCCVVDFVSVLPHGVHHLPELGYHLGGPNVPCVFSSNSSKVLLLEGRETLQNATQKEIFPTDQVLKADQVTQCARALDGLKWDLGSPFFQTLKDGHHQDPTCLELKEPPFEGQHGLIPFNGGGDRLALEHVGDCLISGITPRAFY